MSRYITLGITALLVVTGAGISSAAEDGFAREREKRDDERNAALDALEGQPAPRIDDATGWMNTKDGAPLDWEQLHGKVVLIDFWGVWCGPCRKAIPHVKELAEKFASEGLVVIGIHTDNDADKGPEYVIKEEIPYPVAFDTNNVVIPRFRVNSYPDYYLIDRAGNLRFADIVNGQVDRAIEMLLSEPAPES